MLFHMRESLAWGGPWPLPIIVIVFVVEKWVWAGGIVSVVQGTTFSSSHLFLIAWLVRHPVSGIRDCPHGNGFCWFEWCLRFPPETFHSLRSGHAQGLLGSGRLGLMGACPMGVWSYHIWLLFSLAHKFFPQTAPIVGSTFGRFFTIRWMSPNPTNLMQ